MQVFSNDKKSSTPQLPGVQLQRLFSTQKHFWSQSFPWGLRLGTQLYKASKMSHLDFFLHQYMLKKKKKVLFLVYLFPVLQHSKRSSPCPTCYRRGGRKIRQPGDAGLILHILISDHSPKRSYRGFKCSRNCRIVLLSHELLEFPPPYSTRFVSQTVTVLRYLLFSLYTLKDLIYPVNWKHASNANRYQGCARHITSTAGACEQALHSSQTNPQRLPSTLWPRGRQSLAQIGSGG